jgi:acylphosphatase
MTTKICMHCLVNGRVQGVSFRHYTRQQAHQLGVSGWVRNLRDGKVEVLVCGEAKAVERLCLWLHQGPPLSEVMEVKCQKVAYSQIPEGFDILH